MLKVKGKYGEFSIERKQKDLLIDGQVVDLDTLKLSENEYHVISNNRSFNIELIKAELQSKEFEIKVNGNTYHLEAWDELDLLLEKLGMEKGADASVEDLKAPMPGLVIDINVEGGQEVKKGDALIILEAMKMENVLKAPADLTIKEISVQKGQTVDKNAVLIKF